MFERAPECQGEEAHEDVGLQAAFGLMVNGAQAKVALGGAERGLGGDELDIPFTISKSGPGRFRGSWFAANTPPCFCWLSVSGIHIAPEVQPAGQASGVAPDFGGEDFRGGGVFARDSSDAASDLFLVFLRGAFEPGMDFRELGGEFFALPGEHGFFLFRPCGAAAQHMFFVLLRGGMRDQRPSKKMLLTS